MTDPAAPTPVSPSAPEPAPAPLTPQVPTPGWTLVTILRALGNQDRLMMLQRIAAAPEGLSVAEVAAKMRRKRNAVGKQLAMLRRTQIVVLREDAEDGRAAVHILHPALRPPAGTPPGAPVVLEMGAITLRL